MSDIVERLREKFHSGFEEVIGEPFNARKFVADNGAASYVVLYPESRPRMKMHNRDGDEAADEITALRARIAELEASIADQREDAARAAIDKVIARLAAEGSRYSHLVRHIRHLDPARRQSASGNQLTLPCRRSTVTPEMLARAERIADRRHPQQFPLELWQEARSSALAAIIETQEWAAGVADKLGGDRGPNDAVSDSNRAQHTRARTIAAAIRAGG